jgi:acetyltransferase-like isoleucine patch superfamily enzyme
VTATPPCCPVPPWDWYRQPLPANVVFGENCWMPTGYSLHRFRSRRPCGLRVGADTAIGAQTFFDVGPDGEVVVGATCNIVGAGFVTNGRVTLGDHVLISVGVLFADHAFAAPPTGMSDERYRGLMPSPSTETTVGNDVWIGVGVVVLGGVTVGDGAIVGAATVVDQDVPAHAVFAGNPGRVIGWARPQDRLSDAGVVE